MIKYGETAFKAQRITRKMVRQECIQHEQEREEQKKKNIHSEMQRTRIRKLKEPKKNCSEGGDSMRSFWRGKFSNPSDTWW